MNLSQCVVNGTEQGSCRTSTSDKEAWEERLKAIGKSPEEISVIDTIEDCFSTKLPLGNC